VPEFKDYNQVSFGVLQTILGAEGLRVAVYNMLIGNQIIVRGDNVGAADMITKLLLLILPDACSPSVLHSNTYRDAWEAPLLFLPSVSILPSHLTSDSFALIDFQYSSSSSNLLYEHTWKVHGISFPTTLGEAIERVMVDKEKNINNSIILLVEEWLSKAKVYAKLRVLVGSSKDKRLYDFARMMGLEHLETDFRVLAFWTTGLRQSLRSSIYKQ